MDGQFAKQSIITWFLPVLFLIIQCLPQEIGICITVILLLLAALMKKERNSFLLLAFCACGFFIWTFLANMISIIISAPLPSKVLGRFGLIGYIIIFMMWNFQSKTVNSYLCLGDIHEIIRFPFIWKGRQEPIWRFILIFCGICVVPIAIGMLTTTTTADIFGYGIIFTLVNACLEEVVWRGLILPKAIALTNELQALIITALAFGLYHLSLGFPIWACLIFSVGGFYMGGAAIKSQGLLAPFIMHVAVNIIFVIYGLIF